MPPGLYNPFQVLKPLRVLNPFGALQPGYTDISKPLPGETPFEYEHRKAVVANAGALEGEVNAIGRNVGRAGSYLFGDAATQQQQQAGAKPSTAAAKVAPGSVFPESFNDSAYDAAEANAARITGVPQDLLKAIRIRGERSNASAVSTAGARTPYQIIPGTRAGIQRNYKIDPWSNPENAALGAAYVLREQAGGQGAQGPNWQDPMTKLKAVGGYFGGARGAANPTSQDLRDTNMSVGQYTANVLGDTLVNPFQPRFAQAQMDELEKARLALKTPTRTDFEGSPMPTPPIAPPVPKTDFSGADRALQALKPVEFTMKEAENLRWANFWGGLGQAMMRSPEGEGLGSFFLRLGGAGLASVGQTRSDIQARKDEFDNKMAKWNAALYEHDFNKAQIMQNELQMDWQTAQNQSMEEYKAGMEVWGKTAVPQLVGSDLVFTNLDPKTGKGSIVRQPIGPLVDAAIAQSKAGVYSQAFGVDNAASASVARVANGVQAAIATTTAGRILASDEASDQEKAAASAFVPVMAINYAADTGQIASVIGDEEAEALTEDVVKTLTSQGIYPGDKGYEDAFKKAAVGRLTAFAMQSPETMKRLMETMAPAAQLYQGYERYQNRTEQYTTNSRGQSQQRTTYEGPDE